MTDEGANVVGEQAVKAHIPKSQFVVAAPQMALPVGAQRDGRVVAPDRVLPEVRERRRRVS
jgi:hypothetical protein